MEGWSGDRGGEKDQMLSKLRDWGFIVLCGLGDGFCLSVCLSVCCEGV